MPKCIIVDDELIDRLTLEMYIRDYSDFELSGKFSSAEEALESIDVNRIDIAFLDIDMGEITGLDLRRRISEIPVCIFVSAYGKYALESFDLNTLDFLTKPLTPERFRNTIERINDYLSLRKKAGLVNSSENSLTIKFRHKEIKIALDDILYLEAMKDYTLVVTEGKRYPILSGLGKILEEDFFSENFIRIHRSYAVPKHLTYNFHHDNIKAADGTILPIGKAFRNNL